MFVMARLAAADRVRRVFMWSRKVVIGVWSSYRASVNSVLMTAQIPDWREP